MNAVKRLLFVWIAVYCAHPNCVAETILFESGALGQTGIPIAELLNQNVPGTNVNPAVFTGVRFQLHQPVITSQVGGHFVANSDGTFFGAIIELEDENDFPDSGDFTTDDFLGATTLTFPDPSNAVFGDLELMLDPGWYALVFGSGLFETLGSGGAVRNGTDIGNPPYLFKEPNLGWFNASAFPNHRFVVKGQVVPETSTAATLLLGSLVRLRLRRT